MRNDYLAARLCGIMARNLLMHDGGKDGQRAVVFVLCGGDARMMQSLCCSIPFPVLPLFLKLTQFFLSFSLCSSKWESAQRRLALRESMEPDMVLHSES